MILAAAFLALAVPDPAGAADITVDAPAESTVGEPVAIIARVTDGGEPVPEAPVAVTRQAEFGGVSGFVTLDEGVTDEAGTVSFEFVQYADATDVEQMRIEYEGPDGVESTPFELTVLPGTQQYVTSAGIDLGVVNVSWLLVVLGIVWVVLLVAVWQLLVISRARDGSERSTPAVPYVMLGFVGFTAIGMFIVILTQPTTHASLDPADPFERSPAAVLGQEYEYGGHGSQTHHPADQVSDTSGEELYLQAGCSSCHGIAGRGAVVGGELTESMLADPEEFADAVRRGPKGMPAYSETALTDAELEQIVDYLLESDGG